MSFLNDFALRNDFFGGLLADIKAHGVIDITSRVDHFGVVTNLHGFVHQIVGVYANAMATNKARVKLEKVPFGAGGLEYVIGIDAELVKDD